MPKCEIVPALLQNIEIISSCRDRGRLPSTLLHAVESLLGGEADVGIFSRGVHGHAVLRLFSGPTLIDSVTSPWDTLLNEVRSDGQLVHSASANRDCGVVGLHASELGGDFLILAYDVESSPSGYSEEISCLTRIYANQLKLLDYSELDTLTRLMNRKTFDETFDRLLNAPSDETPEHDESIGNRRSLHQDSSPAWLCVVDIDHFKRINDSFGHLFGDEVLLRLGDLMRNTFREGDRLFRFGGEEFVVILNAPDEHLASASFERFKDSVENHEFPQVGKVTCSIGFTSVSAMDVPTDVLGRADEALYFAKAHGRNQVRCYEKLVDDGLIVKTQNESSGTADFDIDALFG